VFGLENSVPQDAQMKFFIVTPKSLIKIPFMLPDIALP
jgi:hypothetical protein